jgi:hypothetical protein
MDLQGRDRSISSIEMAYRALPNRRDREPTVCVEGLLARAAMPGPGHGPPSGRDWVELGCQQVALIGKDKDTIRVGRREGRFKAVRLQVRGADVEIINLRVVYTNGDPDDIQVRHLIRAGERTRPLDLKGRERSIDRVDLVYRTNFNPVDMIAKQRIKNATVCVEGLD